MTQAFTTCHSTAEVYRLDAIEKVFGSFDGLKPATLAELIQQMRGNLLGVWRQPAEQEKNKTKRREKDIRAEVLRGYEVARAVVDRGLAKHPDQWALVLAKATIMHDENNYLQEIERSTEFAPRRQAAFAEFQRAAQLYVKAVPSIEQNDETVQVFDYWYSASLGACDPQHITEETLADLRQPKLIREALESIKGEPGERHQNKFANSLFTRLNMVKPSIKFRYLKAGFEIVGDNPQAFDARKVFDYYKDLVTEIKLETKVDGSDVVGHGQPFGLFVNLRHTREIERESGGFCALSPESEQCRILLLQLRPAARELSRQVSGRRQAGAPRAFRGHVGHLPGREGQLEGDGRVWLASDAVCLHPVEGPRPQGRQGPAAAAGPRLHGHLGLRGPARRIAGDPGRRDASQGVGAAVRKAPDHPDARRAAG